MKRIACIIAIIFFAVSAVVGCASGTITTPADLAKEFTFKDDGMSCVAEYFEDCDQFVIALLPDFTEAEWLSSNSSLRSDYMDSFNSICSSMVSMLDNLGYPDTIVVGLMMTSDTEFIAFSVDGHNLQDMIG